MATGAGDAGGRLAARLPWVGLAVAVWALLPPYTGPELNTEQRVEVADHVVPAVLMGALALAALVRGRRGGAFPLVAGLGIALAGLWMTATHVPLVNQARSGQVTYGAAAWHTTPGLVVLALGAVWAAVHWSAAAGPPEA